jgi:ferric iron reductase protein FhuF
MSLGKVKEHLEKISQYLNKKEEYGDKVFWLIGSQLDYALDELKKLEYALVIDKEHFMDHIVDLARDFRGEEWFRAELETLINEAEEATEE